MEHDLIVVVLCNEKSKVTNSLKRQKIKDI